MPETTDYEPHFAAAEERLSDKKHWDRGQKSKDAAESDKLIHIAVGHALTNWEHVEGAACSLFTEFTDTGSIAAERAYGTINGARARGAAVREAMKVYFILRKQAFKKDREVYDRMVHAEKYAALLIHNYEKASSRRNDIAHGMAWELSFDDSTTKSWYLVAPNYQSGRTINWIEDDVSLRTAKGLRLYDKSARFEYNKIYYKNSEYIYGMQQIKTYAGKFAHLFADILSFLYMINSERFKLSPDRLYALAKALSA